MYLVLGKVRIVIPISQMWRQRFREVKEFAEPS